MLDYKLKGVHVDYVSLHCLYFKQNNNIYTRSDNNHGDGFCAVIYYGGCLWGTVLPENTVFFINNILTIRD